MFLYSAWISITSLFTLLSLCFLSIGIYAMDFSLIIISVLFIIAAFLSKLEMKELRHNPFID